MSILVIGDSNTVLGFRLLGIRGEIAESPEAARKALEAALQEDLKLILMTREWAAAMPDLIDRLKMTRLRPVVMEIPGPEARPPARTIDEMVRRAIGIKV